MGDKSPRLNLDRFDQGETNWDHTDLVNAVDELAIDRGPIADRPASGDYDDQLYYAVDQELVWRWDATAADWIAVSGRGSADQPLPGTVHREAVSTVEARSTTSRHSVAANKRTNHRDTFPNITELRNNLQEFKNIDSHVLNSYGRLQPVRADSDLGTYHLYYATGSDEISLMYSDDGWIWTDYGAVVTGIGRNIEVVPRNGTYHVFFNPTNTEIHYQQSNDGYSDLSSTGTTQLLSASASGWDQSSIRYPAVEYREGEWVLHYMGRGGGGTWRMGAAVAPAPDGNYTKSPLNPLVEPYGGNGYADVHAFDPSIMVVGGTTYNWYTLGGSDSGTYGTNSVESCGLATSEDGSNFRPHGENPIIPRDAFGEAETLNPKSLIVGDEWHLYFTSRDKDAGTGSLVQTRAKIGGE